MSGNQRGSFTDRSRPWRVLLAGLGGLWAAMTLPLTATAFGFTQWVWVFDYPVYVEARQLAGNPYVVFGALASLSFLTIGIALLPDLQRARWGGAVMAGLIIVGAPLTALSYLNASEQAPSTSSGARSSSCSWPSVSAESPRPHLPDVGGRSGCASCSG